MSVAVTILAGAGVLAVLLRTEPGSTTFYALSVVLAAVWGVGALVAGPVALRREEHPPPWGRAIAGPVAAGVLLVAVFALGALIVRSIGPLDEAVRRVASFTGDGVGVGLLLVTVVAGVGEELCFRGALYDAVPRHPIAVTTIAYGAATAVSGNIMLAFAALLLGVVTGLQRRATHGVLAPALTHVTWSCGMLLLLPALFPPA